MRWPFGLFGRSRSEGESAEARAPAGPAVPRASGRDWAALPPIQRSVGDTPLTASSRSFAAGLPGAMGMPLALQPLGHARALDAPAGLVTGLATPSTYAGQERLVYVQRRAAAAAARPDHVWPDRSDAPAGGAPAPPEAAAAGEVVPAVEPPPPLPAPLAPRAVPAVAASPAAAPLTVSTMPETSLPVAPLVGSRPAASTPAAPVVQTASADAPAAWQAPVAMPVRRLNVGQSRRIGLGAPLSAAAGEAAVQRSADSSVDEEPGARAMAASTPPQPPADGEDEETGPPVQRLADPVRPSPPLPAPAVPPRPRPAVTPLPPPEPPPSPALPSDLSRPIYRVQRRPAGSPASRSDAPLVGRVPEPPPAMPVVPESAPAPSGADPALPPVPVPVVPVQRLEAEPTPAPGPGQDPLPVVPAQRMEVRPGPGSDVPSLPVVPVQRSGAEPMDAAAHGPGEEEDEEGQAGAASLPVVAAQRLEAGAPPVHLAAADLPVVPVQRSVAVPDAPGEHGRQAPLAMPVPAAEQAAPPGAGRRVAGPPVVQTYAPGTSTLPLVGDRPLPVSISGGRAGTLAAPPVVTALAAGPAPLTYLPAAAEPFVQRVADVAAGAPAVNWPALPTTEAATAALAPVARVTRTVAQTSSAVQPAPPSELPYLPVAAPGSPAEPFVQRAPTGQQYFAIDVPIIQRAEDAPAAAPSSGGAGGAEGGGAQHSDKELDELARQLYERVRSRFRMELLVDRERAGLITDLR